MKYFLPFLALTMFVIGCGSPSTNETVEPPTQAVISAPSHYIIKGDTFYADVYPLVTGDWSDRLTFNIEDTTVKWHWEKGVLKLAVPASVAGIHTFEASLSFNSIKAPAIQVTETFIVAEPISVAASSSLIKDQKNNVNISVQGSPPSFDFRIDNAEIEGSGMNYTITPHKTGPLTLEVLEKGTGHVLATHEFIVY